MEERFTSSSGHSAACQTRRLPPHGMWVLPPWGQEAGGGGGVGGMCVWGNSGEKKNLIRYTWATPLAVECGSYSGVRGRRARETGDGHNAKVWAAVVSAPGETGPYI